MAGVLDFLFEGRPPKSVTTYGTTVDNIPQWMSDYTQGLISRANTVAAEPYQAYGGPRIAGFTPDQEQAYDMTRQNVGSYEPGITAAAQMTHSGASASPLNVAAPFLAKGAQSFPGQVDEYMDPYVQNVLDRQATLSKRQLEEQFLPSLQDAFTSAGHFGSDRMMEMGVRGTRDIMEGLQEQQLGALSTAYGQAGDLFNADQARSLQAGQTAGQLAGAEGELQLRGGQQMGALAEALQAMQARDAAGLEAVGQTQQGLNQTSLDTAYQDFVQQRDYPRDNINWMSEIVRGLPASTSTNSSSTGPANIYQPSPLSQIASIYSTYRGLQDPAA